MGGFVGGKTNNTGGDDMNKQERTQAIINNFRDNRDEFQMLKGILCMIHCPEVYNFEKEHNTFKDLIDTGMIASRMDEINRASTPLART